MTLQKNHTLTILLLAAMAAMVCVSLSSCTTVADAPAAHEQPLMVSKLSMSIGEFKSTGNRFALCTDCLPPTVKTAPSPMTERIPDRDELKIVQREVITEMPATVSAETGLKLKLELALKTEIYFVYNSALIGPHSRQVLEALAKKIKSTDDIVVIGSADAEGFATGNVRLAQQRAAAVRDFLIAQGVEQQQIKSKADHLAFVADNSTASGRAKNRRAEVIITAEKN